MKSLRNLSKVGLEWKQLARGYAKHPMTRRAPLRILVNMMGWQLRARILPGDHEVEWIAGTRLLVRRGMTGATGNVYYGLAEYHDMAFALHLLRPEDLFVDVGANIGAYSVLAAGACGSRVVAIEPIQVAAKHLRANLALNDLHPRVEVIEVCIGDREGTVRMTRDFDTTNRVVSGGEPAESAYVEVPMKTLDQILEGKCPVLIKIDTEGYEGNVLLGSQRVLQAPSLLAVSIEGDASKAYPSLDGLTVAGWMNKFSFVPVSYDGSTRTLSTNPSAFPMNNLLFARNFEECRQRLATARSVRVLGAQV
jgi:FkbM family methyltransferase